MADTKKIKPIKSPLKEATQKQAIDVIHTSREDAVNEAVSKYYTPRTLNGTTVWRGVVVASVDDPSQFDHDPYLENGEIGDTTPPKRYKIVMLDNAGSVAYEPFDYNVTPESRIINQTLPDAGFANSKQFPVSVGDTVNLTSANSETRQGNVIVSNIGNTNQGKGVLSNKEKAVPEAKKAFNKDKRPAQNFQKNIPQNPKNDNKTPKSIFAQEEFASAVVDGGVFKTIFSKNKNLAVNEKIYANAIIRSFRQNRINTLGAVSALLTFMSTESDDFNKLVIANEDLDSSNLGAGLAATGLALAGGAAAGAAIGLSVATGGLALLAIVPAAAAFTATTTGAASSVTDIKIKQLKSKYRPRGIIKAIGINDYIMLDKLLKTNGLLINKPEVLENNPDLAVQAATSVLKLNYKVNLIGERWDLERLSKIKFFPDQNLTKKDIENRKNVANNIYNILKPFARNA